MSVKLAHAIQSVKQWNKSAKRIWEQFCLLLEETDFILEKRTTIIPTRKRDDLVMSVVNNRGVRFAKPRMFELFSQCFVLQLFVCLPCLYIAVQAHEDR